MTPALPFAPQKEAEEAPGEEIITAEPAPCMRRESRVRRSGYAFSHREGYADLITQGAILRRTPGVSSGLLAGHTIPRDEELPSSAKESPWCSRKMSFLGRRGHQHGGGASSAAMRPPSVVSSSLTVGGQDSHFSLDKDTAATTNAPSRPLQEELPVRWERSLSLEQRWCSPCDSLSPAEDRPLSPRGRGQLPPSESQSQFSGQPSSESQPAHLKGKVTP